MGAGALNGHSKETSTQNFTSSSYGYGVTSSASTLKSSTTTTTTTDKLKPNLQMKMSCEMCSVNFTIFKRKKFCQECHRYFCSNCLPKPPANSVVGRQCSKCRLLVSGHFSREDLQTWKVKDMRCFLSARNISTKDCKEKQDLIELVLSQFCTRPRRSMQDQAEHEIFVREMADHVRNVSYSSDLPQHGDVNGDLTNRIGVNDLPGSQPTTSSAPGPARVNGATETNSSFTAENAEQFTSTESSSVAPEVASTAPPAEETAEMSFEMDGERLQELLESMERIRDTLERQRDGNTAEELPSTAIRRTHIDDIAEVSEIEDLSIRQLKELLVNNFVDYRGCFEKAELIDRVKRLWKDHQANKLRAEKIHKEEESAYYGSEPQTVNSSQISVSDATEPLIATDRLERSETPMSKDDEAAAATFTQQAPESTSSDAPQNSSSASSTGTKEVGDSLCHICMDALVDCILLECGHMVTCTQCGKRLADCPICRQYIVRVVRVFRS
ncbi:unnamed protein product [Lymnaea stagnalis]|uniref:RING-type domain-containing protein n=1 Tax=Lymnaea stagnalis TaxID=6523 RepID=A0AAV2I8I7_LYMST